LKEVLAKAKTLQRTACKLVEREFEKFGAASTELGEGGHLFSKHFLYLRSDAPSPHRSLGLDTLAQAAGMFLDAPHVLARRETEGCSEVPTVALACHGSNMTTDRVTDGRAGVELQSATPVIDKNLEIGTPWIFSSEADEGLNSMFLVTPEFGNWFEMPSLE